MKKVCVLLDGPIAADSRAQRTVRTMAKHAEVYVYFQPRGFQTAKTVPDPSGRVRPVPVPRAMTRMDWALRHSLFYMELRYLADAVLSSCEHYDLVYAHDLATSWAAARIAKRNAAPILYDVHDLTIETINQGFPTEAPLHKRVKYALAKWMMKTSGTWWARRFVRKTALLVAPNQSMTEYQTNYLGAPRTMVLPNYPEYREVVRSERLHDMCGIPQGTKIALYHGNLGRGRFLRRIVASAEHLDEGNALVILGDGALLPELKEIASGPRFRGKAYFHGLVPYDELLSVASAASLGLILIDHINLSKKYALANKLTEYMASGVAVLGSDSPENRRVLTDADAGYLYQVTTAEALGARINELLANPEELAAKGRNGQKAFREKYNWQVVEPAFEKAFLELLGGP